MTAQPHHVVLFRELTEQVEKHERNERDKAIVKEKRTMEDEDER